MWHVPPALTEALTVPTGSITLLPTTKTTTIITMGLSDLHHTIPKKAKILNTV